MEILGYIGAVIMGLSLGLIGGGGSILSVPIFVYLFGIQPSLATGYSLFVVGLTSFVGAFGAAKRKEINYFVALAFSVPSFLGVYLVRRFLMPALPDPVFSFETVVITKDALIMVVFALLMVAASFSMIFPIKAVSRVNEMSPTRRWVVVGIEGVVVGAITGFVGAGGGFLIIPFLVVLMGLRMKEAVGTSLVIITVKSLVGFLGDLQSQAAIDWNFLMIFSALAAAGILSGAYLQGLVADSKLKPAFGYFVLVMGIFILGQRFGLIG